MSEILISVQTPELSKNISFLEKLKNSKKLKTTGVNSEIYLYKDHTLKMYSIKKIKTKNTNYSEKNAKTDISLSELYFLKKISGKSFVFPILEEYNFVDKNLYLTTEWIQGITFNEFLKSETSLKKVYSIIFMTFYGLNILYNHYGIIHNDFHANNILLKKINVSSKYIKVKLNNISFYTLNTGYIPIIWDFGWSYERSDIPNKKGYNSENIFKTKGIDNFTDEHLVDLLALCKNCNHFGIEYAWSCFYKIIRYSFNSTFENLQKIKYDSFELN